MNKKGFTLIELLVVIATISLLSSVVFASLNNARKKGRDAYRVSSLKSVKNALELYYSEKGYYPNYQTGDYRSNFTNMAQELVTEGLLSGIPVDNNPPPGTFTGFEYYRYGAGTIAGALLITALEGKSGPVDAAGSCPAFTGSTWCSDTHADANFCICSPY